MRDGGESLPGWVGPWVACGLLVGWKLWSAISTLVSPDRPFVVAGLGLGAILMAAVFSTVGRTRRADLAALLLWVALGWIIGVRATHPVASFDVTSPALGAVGSTFHVVSVDEVSTSQWSGALHATLSEGRWRRFVEGVPVSGWGGFPGSGDWVVEGELHPLVLRPPARTGSCRLDVLRVFRLTPGPTKRDAWLGWERFRDRWREDVVARWHDLFGARIGAFAGWVLLGVRPESADRLREPFVRTGTAHLLAISGLHVGLLAGAVWAVLRLLLQRPRLARWLTAVVLLAYAALTGGAVSVLRSAGMFLLVALGPAWGRRGRGWNALGWAAALLPVFLPELPSRPAYVLSVGATAGVLLGARAGEVWKPRNAARGRRRALFRLDSLVRIIPAVAASMGAQLATWGQSLHYFSLASFTGLAINLVAIPLAGLVVPALLLAGLVGLHPRVDGSLHVVILARSLSTTLLDAIGFASRFGDMLVGRIPEATATLGTATALVSLWAVVRLHGGNQARLSRGGLAIAAASMALLSGFVLPTLLARLAHPPHRGLRATFLDVGQGDAVLLEVGGARWLYDTGPPPARNLVRALEEAGIERLDRVFVTHGDQDHWGGIAALLESPIRVDTLSISAGGPWPDRFWETLESAGSPVEGSSFPPRRRPVLERIGAGWERSWRGMRCRVLHPKPGFVAEGRNDHSIVLRFEDGPDGERPGTGRLLLIGDLESPGQEALLAAGELGRVDIAQAGHHGSGTSLAAGWYERIAPGLVVASLALDNRYGFPHPALVEKLDERGIRFCRTDEMGAFGVSWDGRDWTVRSGGSAPWRRG